MERCRDLLEEERFREAFELAVDILQRAPRDTDAVCIFADAALAVERPAKAIRACRRYLRSRGADIEVLEWLVRAQFELHLAEECQRTCRELLKIEPDNYTALDYGLAAVLDLQNFESAADLIDAAARHHQDDPHLTYQTAVARMMRGDDEWARRRFEEFLAEDADEPGTYINLMRIHHLAERFGEVEKLFEKARDRGIDHEDLHFNMGLALKAQEQDRKAARCFIRALKMNSTMPDTHFHLGQILRTLEHERLALAMLERELSVDDTQPQVHAEMAWCAEDLGLYEPAVRMIEAAVERAPEWGVYHHSLSEILLKAGRSWEEAVVVARKAVAMEPTYAAGWQVLGRAAAHRGELDEAERCLRRAVSSRSSTAEDDGRLGLLLLQRGSEGEAVSLLERALRIYPAWETVSEALARVRGQPLLMRYEVSMISARARRWYRVLHVVADSEETARALTEAEVRQAVEIEDVRALGYEVDRDSGLVWDSGERRHPLRMPSVIPGSYPPPPADPVRRKPDADLAGE